MRFILAANTARFAANPPRFLAPVIFFVVALPKLPNVPFRFILAVAACIHLFLVAIVLHLDLFGSAYVFIVFVLLRDNFQGIHVGADGLHFPIKLL